MKCKNCFNLEKIKDYARGDIYDWCVVKHDNPDTDMERDCPFYKPTTNYDRIVSKTPEELAEFLIQDGDCPPERMYPDSCPNCDRVTPKSCYDCWLDWLKQEATE